MNAWVDWSMQAKAAAIVAGIGLLGTIGEASTGWQVLRDLNPFVTHGELIAELTARAAARDLQLSQSSDAVKKQIGDLTDKIEDIDDRSLRWRVDDYPSKISNAKANLASLKAAAEAPGLSFAVTQTLSQQIDDTDDLIAALERDQKSDTCILINLHRITPLSCP